MVDIKKYIDDVPDFPKEGILFRDIQPLLADSEAFYDAVYAMGELIDMEKVDSETWGLSIWDMTGTGVVSYWGSLSEIEDYMIEEFKLSINFCDDKGVITK